LNQTSVIVLRACGVWCRLDAAAPVAWPALLRAS